MATKRAEKLTVEVAGARSFIQVPSNRAAALHNYLRAYGIPTSPPQPCTADIDSIELGRGLDVKSIQALLDRFG